jgi:hypothetical protein
MNCWRHDMTRDQMLQELLADMDPMPDLQNWWQDNRASKGLRLSQHAHQWLSDHDFENWKFEINPTWITPRNMLRMDRLIPVPYSLCNESRPRRSWIHIWDSGQAMTIELLGDFDRFLAALERAWPKNS